MSLSRRELLGLLRGRVPPRAIVPATRPYERAPVIAVPVHGAVAQVDPDEPWSLEAFYRGRAKGTP